jgi:uncharacterized protein
MINGKQSFVVLVVAILLGMLGGSFLLGKSLESFRKADRYVTVKGFSEREVKSDLVVWPINVRAAHNDLAEASKAIETAGTKVVQFLMKNEFRPEEIAQKDLRVVDRQSNEYGSGNAKDLLRYVVEATIVVRSNNVDQVEKVSRMTDDLVRAGVVLGTKNEWRGAGPRFIFTKLQGIKPEMMAEATRNAKTAADQFAKESGSKVGAIRMASQGLFSIADRDEFSPGNIEESNRYAEGTSDLHKRVRVVVTIQYFLN